MARVAFILADMFEDAEFQVPWDRITGAGHQVAVVGLQRQAEITGKKGAKTVTDLAIAEVRPDEFNALVIPGGYSPDKLRVEPAMVDLVRQHVLDRKPVAAICHAGSMLADPGRPARLLPSTARPAEVTSAGEVQLEGVHAGPVDV